MTKDLTEQWKNGELEEGFYYLKDNEYIFIDHFNGVSFEETCDFEIKEVLAPVPSYEKWQQMKAFCEEFNALKVAEENTKLKELLKNVTDECDIEKQKALLKINQLAKLLKECKGLFNRATVYGAEPNNAELITILTKIDEVLK